MHHEELSLDHQSLLEQKFKDLEINISEYSFANLFLFRKIHDYSIVPFAEEIFVKGKTREGLVYWMPTTDPKRWSHQFMKELAGLQVCLYPLPEEWLIYFEAWLDEYSFSEAESDYLFSCSKFASYAGRRLSKKRNLVTQLLARHTVLFRSLSRMDSEDVRKILEHWQRAEKEGKDQTDYYSMMEAFELREILGLQGREYFVDDLPAGLIIGEWLNSRCFVVHFAKARKDFHGLYQWMYQDLAKSIADQAEYINLEQDLGIPQLRQSKHSYQPDRLIHKYLVKLRCS